MTKWSRVPPLFAVLPQLKLREGVVGMGNEWYIVGLHRVMGLRPHSSSPNAWEALPWALGKQQSTDAQAMWWLHMKQRWLNPTYRWRFLRIRWDVLVNINKLKSLIFDIRLFFTRYISTKHLSPFAVWIFFFRQILRHKFLFLKVLVKVKRCRGRH